MTTGKYIGIPCLNKADLSKKWCKHSLKNDFLKKKSNWNKFERILLIVAILFAYVHACKRAYLHAYK